MNLFLLIFLILSASLAPRTQHDHVVIRRDWADQGQLPHIHAGSREILEFGVEAGTMLHIVLLSVITRIRIEVPDNSRQGILAR
jgi:hypothetical protein